MQSPTGDYPDVNRSSLRQLSLTLAALLALAVLDCGGTVTCPSDCVEERCVSEFIPDISYLHPFRAGPTTSYERLLLLGRPDTDVLNCSAPLECPPPTVSSQVQCTRSSPFPQDVGVELQCEGPGVTLIETTIDTAGEIHITTHALEFDEQARLSLLTTEASDLHQRRTYTYASESAENASIHTLFLEYQQSAYSLAYEARLNGEGLVEHVIATQGLDQVYVGNFVYDANRDLIEHSADLDGDGATDEIDRFLYVDDVVAHVEIELQDGQSEVLPVGNCCSPVCGGDRASIAPFPPLD